MTAVELFDRRLDDEELPPTPRLEVWVDLAPGTGMQVTHGSAYRSGRAVRISQSASIATTTACAAARSRTTPSVAPTCRQRPIVSSNAMNASFLVSSSMVPRPINGTAAASAATGRPNPAPSSFSSEIGSPTCTDGNVQTAEVSRINRTGRVTPCGRADRAGHVAAPSTQGCAGREPQRACAETTREPRRSAPGSRCRR
jgi:hypothetical protein